MELRHLQTFQTVVRLKTLSDASKHLFISQPSVTAHINELEKELNTKLLIRGKAPVELTEAGKHVIQYVDQILSLQEQLVGTVAKLKEGKLGSLSIALSGPDCYWLSPIVEKFSSYYKNADFYLDIASDCMEIKNKVVNRELHFGIIKQETPTLPHISLNSLAVNVNDLLLVFSAKHKFARYDEITVSDIAKIPLIVYAKNTSCWENQLKPMFQAEKVEPRIGIESSDHQAAKLLLQTCLGAAFLPEDCVCAEIAQGTLMTKPVKNWPPFKRYSVLLYHKDLVHNEITLRFLERMIRRNREIQFIQ